MTTAAVEIDPDIFTPNENNGNRIELRGFVKVCKGIADDRSQLFPAQPYRQSPEYSGRVSGAGWSPAEISSGRPPSSRGIVRSTMNAATSLDRPRIVAIGVDQGEVEALRHKYPATTSFENITRAAISDYDMLVTRQASIALDASEWINVLRVGWSGITPDRLAERSGAAQHEWALTVPGSKSQRYTFGSKLPESIAPLLSDCADAARAQAAEPNGLYRLRLISDQFLGVDVDAEDDEDVTPFLITTDHSVIAGSVISARGHAVWFVPFDVDLVSWVDAAVSDWGRHDPERFPSNTSSTEWWRDQNWETECERVARSRLHELEAAHETVVAAHLQRQTQITAEIEAAAVVADGGERRLLTAQGDDLVEAVIDALTKIGLLVTNRDDGVTDSDRLQDLHVADPDLPDRVVIAEVRGYGKSGGKATDLNAKIRRFRERYIKSTGEEPHASWYIANQTIHLDPSARPMLLQGAQPDIDTFAENADGLVIDTVQLFRVLRRIERGEVDLPEFRARMMAARGRWSPPEAE